MIPLSTPNLQGNEWKYVKECLDTQWVSSAGKYVDLFEEKIAEYTNSKYAVACVNGTSALQVSLRIAGIKPGDEVIVPTLTFIAPVNAIAYNNASPIFMDSDKYYNIDVEKTIKFIKNETIFKEGVTYNKKTNKIISGIIPVHMWGNCVWLDELIPLCMERNIAVIEDASESLGSFYKEGNYRESFTGSIGKLGCLSFNGNKIITSGGGGMVLTDNEYLYEKALYLTTQAKDDPIRYVHNEIGYNFRLTNIQAALGVGQLEQLPFFIEQKQNFLHKYRLAINKVKGLKIAESPNFAVNNNWMILLQINKEIYGEDREVLMKRLNLSNIQTRPAWAPIHLQKPYKKYQRYLIDKAVKLVDKSLCLPSSTNLSFKNIDYVIKKLKNEN
jgi:perosamine synthetase